MPDTANECQIRQALKTKKAHFHMGLSRYFASQFQRVLIGGLFPLNRRRWFAADVVHDTGNAVDFIDDAVGDAA